MPKFERFTVKSAEAVQQASTEARQGGNPQIEDLHLLSALLGQEEGIVVPMLQKVGVNVTRMREEVRAGLEKLPKQYGGSQPGISRELAGILDDAEARAREMKDEYVSTEHLLLARKTGPGDRAG